MMKKLLLTVACSVALSACNTASIKQSITSFDNMMTGKEPREPYTTIEQTPLKGLFDGDIFDSERSSYPRVALTVLSSPDFHADLLPLGRSGTVKDGCFDLSAVIWRNASSKEDVSFTFCTPDEGAYGVPLSEMGYWAITPVSSFGPQNIDVRFILAPAATLTAIPSMKRIYSKYLELQQGDKGMRPHEHRVTM